MNYIRFMNLLYFECLCNGGKVMHGAIGMSGFSKNVWYCG